MFNDLFIIFYDQGGVALRYLDVAFLHQIVAFYHRTITIYASIIIFYLLCQNLMCIVMFV